MPKLGETKDESELELVRSILMTEYKNYKEDLVRKKSKEKTVKGEKIDQEKLSERNQEWDNLSAAEKRGLSKLKQRVKSGEILIIKTDKSGKLGVISKEKYLEMGQTEAKKDRKIERGEFKKVEKAINDHTRMICKIVNEKATVTWREY